jgi:hypothetical protein
MTNIIKPEWLEGNNYEIIIASSIPDHKKIVQISYVKLCKNGNYELINEIHVLKNHEIVYTSDHLSGAVRKYNKL